MLVALGLWLAQHEATSFAQVHVACLCFARASCHVHRLQTECVPKSMVDGCGGPFSTLFRVAVQAQEMS